MTSDNCASAFEDDEKIDVPTRKRSQSRYSSRRKNRKDGYSTNQNESEFENSSTYGFYQGNGQLENKNVGQREAASQYKPPIKQSVEENKKGQE